MTKTVARHTAILGVTLLALALGAGAGLVAQVGDRSAIDSAPPPAGWTIPPAPVRSPDESMRMMEIAPGFRIELVAAEPLVEDPISFSFDERNRLWVLEWPSYNWPLREVLPGFDPQPAPTSRLVVLTDTDGDGRMDRRSVFAEMEWPRGFQLVDGGVLLFALPDVLFLRDTDGDDKADTREVVVGGLPIPVNPHTAPSSPSWTLDNWTYGLQVGERLRVSGGRRVAGPAGRMAGQWGMSHDDYGRLLFSYNQDHIRGSLVPNAYAHRNPNYDALAGVDVRIGMDNEVWPHAITPGVNRRAQLHDDGRLRVFTANSAPAVYRGDQFPAEYRGNVFLGEAAGRLIRRSVLTETDGIISGTNAYDRREFLFSHDERFRPVFTATGPDGALYVADMYRGIIEGHIFLTTFLRNQILDRRLHQPFHGMGRIYRVVHEGRPRGVLPSPPDSGAAWVPLLSHPNGLWRDFAQRGIVSAGDRSVVPAVRTLATTHTDARTRLHALWTLDGLGEVDDDVLPALLQDASPHVRIAALRVVESRLHADASLRRAVLAVTADADVAVRRQLMFTLGASEAPDVDRARLDLLRRDIERPFVVDAFVSGLAGREHRVLSDIVDAGVWDADTPGHRQLVTALATAIVNEGRAERVEAVVRLASDDGRQPTWRRLALLDGITATRRTSLEPRPASLAALATIRDPQVRAHAMKSVERLTAAPSAAAAEPVDAATAARLRRGTADYALCGACHQQDGRGLPSLAPPLAGAASVIGPADTLIDIVLHGRDESADYPNMPPLASLSDDQLASILTYVRQAWGNAAAPVAAEDVRARRNRAAPATQDDAPDGFTSLFNGRDLSGWRGRPGGGGVFSPYVEAAYSDEERRTKQAEWNADRDLHWSVDTTRGEIVSDGQGVHLATEKEYANFEFHTEWKLTQPGGITGIYLRSYPQVQLWDPLNPTASKTGAFRGSGALWNNSEGHPGKWPLVKADKPIGEWNTLRVRMIGERVWVWLNDQMTVDGQTLDNYFHRGQPLRPRGAIELQSHGTEVRFRRVFIRELPDTGAAR